MAQDDFVSKAMKDSHALMDRMDNSNVSPKKSQFAPKPEEPYNKPHEFSHASYSMAHKPNLGDEVASAAAGLKAKQDNVDAVVNASKQ